jgi:hypothetical protein
MNAAAFSSLVVAGAWLLSSPCLSAQTAPSVEITNAPPFETVGLLQGTAVYDDAVPCGVAVYINVNGTWWNKPNFANPLTGIGTNGSWSCNVATYPPGDVYATKYAAFLVPMSASNSVPILDGKPLPEALDALALAKDFHIQTPIDFSGREWEVKATVPGASIGPGPNRFSTNNVWTDGTGRLHLKINKEIEGGTTNWSCAEVICGDEFGYGVYRFYMDSPLGDFDPSVVFSPFTYSDHTNYTFREIDIEFTTWNGTVPGNAQYAIQQWENSVIVERFVCPPDVTNSVHYFVWAPWRIDFKSLKGHDPASTILTDLIYDWSYTNATQIPPEGLVRPRLNLYLSGGQPPTDDNPVEIIISGFDYLPLLEFTEVGHTASNNTIQLTLQQRVAGLLDLEVSTNLAPVTNWGKLETNVTGNAENPVLFEVPATNSTSFYRGSLHFP